MEDKIGQSARKFSDFDKQSFDLMNRYLKKYVKKMDSKDIDTRSIMAGTYNTACQVLDRIRDVPTHEVIMSVFVYCRDEKYRFISKEFESCIELACIAPDAFAEKLHSFYNNIAAKMKKPGMLQAFAEFMGIFMRLRYTKSTHHVNPNVILAYTDLILQTFDYLRKPKLDTSELVVGISLDDDPLMIKDKYQYFCLAGLDYIASFCLHGKPLNESVLYQRYGFENVNSQEDFAALGRENRIFQNIRGALMPYINEYTFDILPVNHHNGDISELILCETDLIVEEIMDKLTLRRRTLPTNGVLVKFDDPTEYFKTMLLKEVAREDTVILLWKVETSLGDFSGYYDTADKFFYSPFIESGNTQFKNFMSSLILYFYAAAVLDDEGCSDADSGQHFKNLVFSISGKSYGMAGKLKNTYRDDEDKAHTGPRKGSDKYDTRDRAINGYVRKLPAGQVASEAAIEKAKKMGYDLKPDETYVSCFVKSVFYRKDKGKESPQNPADDKN